MAPNILDLNPDYKVWGQMSYASTRRGRFEAVLDWHVVWDAVITLMGLLSVAKMD